MARTPALVLLVALISLGLGVYLWLAPTAPAALWSDNTGDLDWARAARWWSGGP